MIIFKRNKAHPNMHPYATESIEEELTKLNSPKLSITHRTLSADKKMGRHKEVKETIFNNLDSVATSLNLSRAILLMYLGSALKMKEVESPARLVGHASIRKVSQAIESLIKKSILCSECEGLQTSISLNSDNNLLITCKDCRLSQVISFKDARFENYFKRSLQPEKIRVKMRMPAELFFNLTLEDEELEFPDEEDEEELDSSESGEDWDDYEDYKEKTRTPPWLRATK